LNVSKHKDLEVVSAFGRKNSNTRIEWKEIPPHHNASIHKILVDTKELDIQLEAW